MAQSVLEQVSEQIGGTSRKASRAASAVADAFEDGVVAAKRAAKHGGRVAEELLDDTRVRVQQYPFETVAATLAVGVVAGTLFGLMLKRRQC
jgi:ElaB/YqjD/DUF883 family membrane-anchored ribosome-binding protein